MCLAVISGNPQPGCVKKSPDVACVTRVVGGKGAWEDTVKMDRQFGMKMLDHSGYLAHSRFSGGLQRDCAYGKKSSENIRLAFDEKASLALEAHTLALAHLLYGPQRGTCYYSQNCIRS